MKSWYKKLLLTMNIVLYFVTIGIWIAIPDELTLCLSTSIFTITLSMILIIVNRTKLQKYYNSSQFAGFANSFIGAFLLLAILASVNYIFYKKPAQIDLSLNRVNSLSDKTLNILKEMKEELRFKVFATKMEGPGVVGLLNIYKLQKSNIIIDFIDIDIHPEQVKANNISRSMTVISTYKERSVSFYANSELAITNNLLELNRTEKIVAYYSSNHGEVDFKSPLPQGASELASVLKNNLIALKPLNLLATKSVPANGKILIILGPKNPFHKSEIAVVENFLNRGGKLIIGIDPDFNKDLTPNLRTLLNRHGISIPNSIVIDSKKHVNGSSGTVPISANYDNSHPITKEFTGLTFFPLTSPVLAFDSPEKPGVFKMIALSSPYPASWQENNLQELIDGKASYNENVDKKGPIGMMGTWREVSEDQTKKRAKIVAFGNSSFVTNAYKNYSSNIMLFSNALSWSTDDMYLISLNSPAVKENRIMISAPQVRTIFYFSVVFGPLILAIVSFVSYRRRAIG